MLTIYTAYCYHPFWVRKFIQMSLSKLEFEYLIGHNIDFDTATLENAGVTHALNLVCTNAMANFLLPTPERHKLVFFL